MARRLASRSKRAKELVERDCDCVFCLYGYNPPYIASQLGTQCGDYEMLTCDWHARMYREDWFNRRKEMAGLVKDYMAKMRKPS